MSTCTQATDDPVLEANKLSDMSCVLPFPIFSWWVVSRLARGVDK